MKDSRPAEEGSVIRRRRLCGQCDSRFTTFERIQLRDLTVLKNSGRTVPFDREKLSHSVRLALQKRPVREEEIEHMVSMIVRRLENLGESEIPSKTIGQIVMENLAHLDSVAYVRYASVYRNFRETRDFERFIDDEKLTRTEMDDNPVEGDAEES